MAVHVTYLQKCFKTAGLVMREPPAPCELTVDTILAIESIKNSIQKHYDYPRNVEELVRDVREECKDSTIFRYYLYPNINRIEEDSYPRLLSDSLLKLLLSVTPLQDKIADYLFERAIDFAVEGACGPWIKTVLHCFTTLDHIVSPDKIAAKLIDLLDVTIEKPVRLEIISAIPDIVGDREHDNVALEMSRFLSEQEDLTPAILDCLSYLCLSDHHYQELQKKAIGILRTSIQYHYFPNFVKFLLMPGRLDEAGYSQIVDELRRSLNWPTESTEEICSSQMLTAVAIRNTIASSKVIAAAWIKSVSSCKLYTDHKPIDIVIILILYSTTEERQRLVENLLRKNIKLNVIQVGILDEAIKNFNPIFKHYLQNMLDLVNSLLKLKSDNIVVSFATHWYISMFTNLDESRQTITAVLLQHGVSCKQSMTGTLVILKNIAENDIIMLKPQSVKMLALLDKLEDLNLNELREIMNLLNGLAFSFSDSLIRDDMHMIIKKQLESSNPAMKIKGILAAVQAVKYLIKSEELGDEDIEKSEDINYSSYGHLAEGDTREAAQIIELISRSTKLFPDLTGFFYDELSEIMISATYINQSFLSWLTDAVTNDLQQNFMVSKLPAKKINNIKLSMQYSLNNEEELECIIAINIAELVIKDNSGEYADISILPSLCRLVQILHSKKNNGDLGDIDALLGCAIIMPDEDVESCLNDMDVSQIFKIVDCLIHCDNWFRELINGFATQTDDGLKQKIMCRIQQIEEIEENINRILISINALYKPPASSVNISKYMGEYNKENKIATKAIHTKTKSNKRPKFDDTNLPTTAKSQISQAINSNTNLKYKLCMIESLPLRPLNLKVMHLFHEDLSLSSDDGGTLTIKSFAFLLKYINQKSLNIFMSNVKKTTHFSKPQDHIYNEKKAEDAANLINKMMPKLMIHLDDITKKIKHLMQENNEDSETNNTEIMYCLQISLEALLYFIATYLKWIEFRKGNHPLLKSSLRSISQNGENSSSNLKSLKDLLISSAKNFQNLQECCTLVPTAVSLIEVVRAITEISENKTTANILNMMAQLFLTKQWISIEGVPEKGLIFNQYVDSVARAYFGNLDINALKTLVLEIKSEIHKLSGKNDHLQSLKSIYKSNFPILYKHLIGTVHDSAKKQLDKGMTDTQMLDLWKDISKILKILSEIAKILENRNNLSAFLKKSQSVFKLFMSQGMPMMEIKLKTESQVVIEIFKELQYSTKFLQSLCCHSRLKSDNALMAKVPQVRLLLEQFIYKVKAALAANNCSEAFWMGNLKNKNLQGEVIATQDVASEENGDESDDQLPDDNDSENDEEMLNPDSKSISDIN